VIKQLKMKTVIQYIEDIGLMETAEGEDRRKRYTEDMRLMETGEDED
jgi:Mn-dependent DtxR family transcriptional regulator